MAHHTIDLNTHAAKRGCCNIARGLLKTGEAQPDDTISFIRGSTPVFAKGRITWWSQRRIREADGNGPLRFEVYGPKQPTA
jgi:hypothetical protein